MTRAAPAVGGFGWVSIVRLGLVQACLGGIVALTTSTLNRVMVVELALPALLPGLLVGLHYVVQVARPRMGHGSDQGRRRTPWILGGLAVLALGAVLASLSTAIVGPGSVAGFALALVAFTMIGLGVASAGTSLLAMLAQQVAPERRAGAATVVWLMMIFGLAITAGSAGHFLDPYTPARLVVVCSVVSVVAVGVGALALWGVERRGVPNEPSAPAGFLEALGEVWRDAEAKRFTVFVFVSMLAFSAQDLILEPFAGAVFGFTPGESTRLSGLQHGGVLVGMLLAALAGRRGFGSLRTWTVGGCLVSAVALAGLSASGWVGQGWPFTANVMLLGAANGAFSIAAIGSMMRLAGEGRERRPGTRMGLWGAAQALAFAGGGLVGTGAADLAHWVLSAPNAAYASVFAGEALLFLVAAALAMQATAAPRPVRLAAA